MQIKTQNCMLIHNNQAHARIPRGDWGSWAGLENYKAVASLSNSGMDHPGKSQIYAGSIQSRAIIGPQAKHHLNGVSLAGLWLPAL